MKKFAININYLYIIGTIFVIAVFVSLFITTIVFTPATLFETPLYMGGNQVGDYIQQNESLPPMPPSFMGEVSAPGMPPPPPPSMPIMSGMPPPPPSMPISSEMPPIPPSMPISSEMRQMPSSMPSINEIPPSAFITPTSNIPNIPNVTVGVSSQSTLPPNLPPNLLPQNYPTKVNPNLIVSSPTNMVMSSSSGVAPSIGPTGLTQGLIP